MRSPTTPFSLLIYLVLASPTTQQAPDYRTSLCVKEKFTHPDCPIATNVSKFTDLVIHSDVFVDKSLLIYEILRSEIDVILITSPRGWGKSVNLDMLKTFFEMTTDNMGNEIYPKEALSNYRLFVNGELIDQHGTIEKLTAPLLISNFSYLIRNHLGRYPVIYVNLSCLKCTNYNDLLTKFKKMIAQIYSQYRYLAKWLEKMTTDSQVTKTQQRKARRSLVKFTVTMEGQQENITHLWRSVKFLSALLADHFQKPCIILFDEYDIPVYSIISTYDFPRDDEKPVMDFFSNFFWFSLRKNEFMKKGFVTGQHQIGRGTYITPNNIMDHNFIGISPLMKFYGFNQHEVNALFRRLNISTQLAKQAKQWYNGYEIRDLVSRDYVYHPPSIVKFLKEKKIGSLLDNEYDSDLLHLTVKISQLHNTFELLANNKNITINAKKLYINTADIVFFKKLLNDRPETAIKSSTTEIVLAYLCTNGYLTLGRTRSVSNDTTRWVDLRVPNKEIMHQITNSLMSIYETKYLVSSDVGDEMVADLHRFIQNNERLDETLQNTLHRFVLFVPVYSSNYELNYENYKENHRTVISTFNYISFKLRTRYGYETEVPEEAKKPDIIAYRDSRAAFIEIKFICHPTPEHLKVTKKYAGIFQQNDNITEFKSIKIYVLLSKLVQVRGKMLRINQHNSNETEDSDES